MDGKVVGETTKIYCSRGPLAAQVENHQGTHKPLGDDMVIILSGKSPFGKYKTSQNWDYESEVDVTFRVVRFKLDSGE